MPEKTEHVKDAVLSAMSNSTSCVIEPNPDVSGTGIRASIYALCLGGTIVSYALRVFSPGEDEEEFSRGVSSALGMQGMALLCTAIYQTFRKELTLFHAICVVHLLALLGLDLASKGRYSGFGPWRLWVFVCVQVVSLAAFIAFNVYLWVTAPTFGSQPSCNPDTVYVVFGVSIRAVSPIFRYIILGTLGALAGGFILTFTCMLPCVCGAWVYKRRHPNSSISFQAQGTRGCGKWFIPGPSARSETRGPRPSRDRDAGSGQRMSGQALLNFTLNKAAYCGLCIYLIVSLEQTIQRNNLDPQERGWTFGQVIAIFLLLGVANELLNVLLANWDRKIGRALVVQSHDLPLARPASSAESNDSTC
ncbi:hypothetical protein N7539_004144 [Penicillium diatomitis]|uniref:Uncharacterized protein n=1 Tax=Penicillium diatomitis TaxID=2819901 RepID=A0A9X0BY83_9EURO|nr:uncharacterized protein N7539_004144 [Penicillium diatomitis]KAJ5489254.1 hypothetical protein N7539_004144 [Penicillium diatomitis]